MSEMIRYEAGLILLSLSTGAWLMMVYDTLRILRLAVPHHPLVTGLEDFCYWIGASVVTFSLLYEQNGGQLRAYVIGGVLGGMILYDRIVSRSVRVCVGCWCPPSPALITGIEETAEATIGAPSFGCLMAHISA